jgi:heme exporter protein CcmD
MDMSAAHTGFVIAAYGLSGIMLVGLIVYILARDRGLSAEARRLERDRLGEIP